MATATVAAFATGVLPGGGAPAPEAASTPGSSGSAVPARSATEIGTAFLADYVQQGGDDAGRVVRRDQGDDTVSEGQAYGMLVAAALGDEKSFASIWTWTKTNLQRSDGLMAWQWKDGAVVDPMPASDADVDMAHALVMAGATFDHPSWTTAGETLAGHIIDDLTVQTPDGRILLPGPWAQGDGPWSYNASYAAPSSFQALAKATGDDRWSQLLAGTRTVTTKILDSSALPSDWSQVAADGSVTPLPGPTGSSGTVQYGYDAGRVAIRFAQSCQPADTAIAARLAGPLADKDPLPMQLDLGGTALNSDQSPLGYVARAAARASGSDRAGAQADLAAADRLAQSTPTYYGAAWDALGALSLQTDAMGSCPLLKGE